MTFQPDTPEEAANVVLNVSSSLYSELMAGGAGLTTYTDVIQVAENRMKSLTEEIIQRTKNLSTDVTVSLEVVAELKNDCIATRDCFGNILGDLARRNINSGAMTQAKDDAEKLATQIENLEADLNQTIARLQEQEEKLNNARMRYESEIKNVALASQEAYKTYVNQSAAAVQKAEELAQLTEAIAIEAAEG